MDQNDFKTEMKTERAKTERLLSAAMTRAAGSGRGSIPMKTVAEIICEDIDDKQAMSLLNAIHFIKEI